MGGMQIDIYSLFVLMFFTDKTKNGSIWIDAIFLFCWVQFCQIFGLVQQILITYHFM